MKLASTLAIALLGLAPTLASAGPSVTADFEHVWDYSASDINGYYDGGSAADGTSGPDIGISFAGVYGLSNDDLGPYYSGAPSMLGVAYASTFAPEDVSFMNITSGFVDALSFYYSTPETRTGAIRAYSGLNGTGLLLGTYDLVANAGDDHAAWTAATFAFEGYARSFDLTGSANAVAFDNLTVTPIPEPATLALMFSGGAAMLGVVRRRKNRR